LKRIFPRSLTRRQTNDVLDERRCPWDPSCLDRMFLSVIIPPDGLHPLRAMLILGRGDPPFLVFSSFSGHWASLALFGDHPFDDWPGSPF